MDGTDCSGEMETLTRRIEFLETLDSEPLHKADLVEVLDVSRSTVDRAIQKLEEAGFVERLAPGWITTHSGRLAAGRYRQFQADVRRTVDAQAVVDAVPSTQELPPSLLTDADIVTVDGAYELFARLADTLQGAEHCRVVPGPVFDPLHVRFWHSQVVRSARSVELLAAPSVVDRLGEQFPKLATELVDSGEFEVHSVESPPVGAILTSDHGRSSTPNRTASNTATASDRPTADGGDSIESADTAVFVTYDGDEVAGLVTTTNRETVSWVADWYESLREAGERATEELRLGHSSDDLSALLGDSLTPALRSEGFAHLDGEFFRNNEAMSPERGWRAGLGLPEVAAGHALERRFDDGTPVTERILERFDGGSDVVVVGPPGSGKSTVCKRVAYEWVDTRGGTVVYRESGAGAPFESVAALERHLQHSVDPTLVVVEDATRSDANRIFEVMRSLAARDDVLFLFDAREAEWHDPPTLPGDVRLDAYRREAVDTVSMPTLDERSCRRLLAAAERVLDTTLDTDPDTLLRTVRSTDVEGSPGAMLLLSYRLVRQAEPLVEYEQAGSTSLEADVDEVRADLEALGSTALDVGILANVLNAAGVTVYPEYLYAISADASVQAADSQGAETSQGADQAETSQGADQVAAALDRLEGHVLFTRPGVDAYRGIHESWSLAFLERLLELADERAAMRQFGRALGALFALADHPERCEFLARHVSGSTPGLDRIVATPADWADEVVETVFELGDTYAGLAPLFGTTDASPLELPAVCSPETIARVSALRGSMFTTAGAYDRAWHEFEHLETVAANLGDADEYAFRFESLHLRGEIAVKRGDSETAHTYLRAALDLAEARADDYRVAKVFNSLGILVGMVESDFAAAREYHNRALERFVEVGEPHWEARTLGNLGSLVQRQGDYDDAREHLQRSLELVRSLDNRRDEGKVLGILAVIESKQGNIDAAREYYHQSIDLARELGDRRSEYQSLNNLGEALREAGEFDPAREYVRRSLDISRELGDPKLEAVALTNLGNLARTAGDLPTARTHLE